MVKKNLPKMNNSANVNKNIKPEDFKWSGFRKTCKMILSNCEFYKMEINKLVDFLIRVFANFKSVDVDEIDTELFKKIFFNKLEDSEKFVVDLSKMTIRHKSL